MKMHVATIGVYVRDQDEALRFYQEKLGFEVRRKVDAPGIKWYEVAPSGSQATLVLSSKDFGTYAESKLGRFTDIAFDTDDIHALYQTYIERGVTFTSEPRLESYGKWFAAFADPDGNEFFVFQDAAE